MLSLRSPWVSRSHPPRRGEDAAWPGLGAASPRGKASLRRKEAAALLCCGDVLLHGALWTAADVGSAAGEDGFHYFQHRRCHLFIFLKYCQSILLEPFKDLLSHHVGLVASFLPGSWLARPSPFSPCKALSVHALTACTQSPSNTHVSFPDHLGTKAGGEVPFNGTTAMSGDLAE